MQKLIRTERARGEMEQILCVKVASRGDLLLAAPAFAQLRQSRPAAHVTLLVGTSCEDVARHLPYFDEIRTIDDRRLFAGGVHERVRAALDLCRKMRVASQDGWKSSSRAFSEVIIFHRDWRYAFVASVAGIRIRTGFAGKTGSFLLTNPYHASDREHHSQQYLRMVLQSDRAAGQPEVAGGSPETCSIHLAGSWRFEPGERERALAAAARLGFDPHRSQTVGLGFGGGRNVKTRTQLKRWPVERYRALAAKLRDRGYQVVWVGDGEDARVVGNDHPGLSLAGRLSVPETAAVLSACRAVVANDTLTLHLAESVGVPTVGVFGPTDPAHYRPLGEHSSYVWLGSEAIPCSPCHRDGYFPECPFQHRCMNELSVYAVLSCLDTLLSDMPVSDTFGPATLEGAGS